VWWFNERNFPAYVFEIEHTSDFRNALIKFLELQDFNARTVIVSSEKRKNEFVSRIKFTSFAPIKDRVIYMTYDYISQWHSKLNELILTEKIIS
jgi:hypothetical protein